VDADEGCDSVVMARVTAALKRFHEYTYQYQLENDLHELCDTWQ